MQTKLLSDKQIKFKEFFVSSNKFHKNLPRDSFKKKKILNVVLYEIYSKKKRKWRILMSSGLYICVQNKQIKDGIGIQNKQIIKQWTSI
jgi:hypothetical protein